MPSSRASSSSFRRSPGAKRPSTIAALMRSVAAELVRRASGGSPSCSNFRTQIAYNVQIDAANALCRERGERRPVVHNGTETPALRAAFARERPGRDASVVHLPARAFKAALARRKLRFRAAPEDR